MLSSLPISVELAVHKDAQLKPLLLRRRPNLSALFNRRFQSDLATPKPPLDLSHHFSRVTLARKPSDTKQFYRYFDVPGVGNLSAGFPDPTFFPYDTIETKIAQPESFKLTLKNPSDRPNSAISSQLRASHIPGEEDSNQTIDDLATVLQYGTAQGYTPLYSFLKQFTRENILRNVPYINGPDIIPTCGSTDGFSQVLQAFTNTWSEGHDDSAQPRGLQIVPVTVDAEGILAFGPRGLEDVLANWNEANGKRPHLLYTIPTGQNPTGAIPSIERRKEVYAVCSKYDVLIIEDDPCWHLQFPSAARLETAARGLPPSPTEEQDSALLNSSGSSYIDSLSPSYLNVDIEGRVVRLDTFSKSIAPGCRLGWITAQPAIIESLSCITETSTGQASGFVQAMVAQLLMGSQHAAKAEFAQVSSEDQASFAGWKFDGWVRWLEAVRGRYESRMNRMCTILEEGRFRVTPNASPTPIYTFSWPRGGMSVWIRVCFDTHPLADRLPGSAIAHALWMFMLQKPHRVLVTPGDMFSPTDTVKEEHGWQYFRLCFAPVNEEEVEKSSRRFIRAVHAFWEITSEKEVERIESVDPFDD
ncbi:Aromatic amino acid aminotransferase C56E4.03 [Cladobotryum mycophilum]|uniref:Aromatic amino acid aminotransferase C56E4.03 n=1 Tax=Cladobotryum mycophilum TaxID=491253 RepID=A0ABR0S7Y2_9HYPO